MPSASPTSSSALRDELGILGLCEDSPQIEALDHLAERQVRRALAVGDAAAGEHRRLLSTSAISSLARRVLPMPGSPTTADLGRRLALRFLEDGEQPPKLVFAADELRLQIAGHRGAPATSSSSRKAGNGVSLRGLTAFTRTASRTSSSVAAPSMIEPDGAACSIRLATLTACP